MSELLYKMNAKTMIWKKIVLLSALLLVSFIVFRWQTIFSQTTKPLVSEIKTQMPDVSPEVREKAFGLLNEILAESEALKSKPTKLEMQFFVADLLWEKNEVKAREIYQSFVSETSKEDCLCELLTPENLQKLANRDAKIAMQTHYFVPAGDTLDIIFETYFKQYPQETLEISKADLEHNFAMNFFRNDNYDSNEKRVGVLKRLELIYAQNSKNGAEFARAILAKLKESKLNSDEINYEANKPANKFVPMTNSNLVNLKGNYLTNSPANSFGRNTSNVTFSNSNIIRNIKINNVDFSKVREFFEMTLASREVGKNNQTQILTESELGDLAKLMVNALIATKSFNSYEVQGIYNGLKKYAPTEMAKLETGLSAKQLQEIKKPHEETMFGKPFIPERKTSIKKIQALPNETSAEKEDREFVNKIYDSLSFYVDNCNIENDAIRFAQIPNKSKYPDLIEYFEEYMQTAYAKIGNVKELRKYLKKETNSSRKIELLSFAADAVTTQKDKNDLGELLKESNVTIPKQYKNVTEFQLVINYAKILSATSPTESFEYLENQLNTINTIVNNAAIIAEFNEDTSQDNGELRFAKMQEQIAKNSPFTIGMIKKLAHFDFERTKKLADKFTRPEVRLFIKWHIANSLLNKNASDEEAKFYEVEPCG